MSGIVYDVGSSNNISNCFPVRSCSNFATNGQIENFINLYYLIIIISLTNY